MMVSTWELHLDAYWVDMMVRVTVNGLGILIYMRPDFKLWTKLKKKFHPPLFSRESIFKDFRVYRSLDIYLNFFFKKKFCVHQRGGSEISA